MRNPCCTLCLSVNRKTVSVHNTNLQQLYEKLADFKVKDECWMCYVCHTKLQQCQQLQQLAVQTRGLVDDFRQNKTNYMLKEFKPVVELSLIKTQIICSSTSFSYMDESFECRERSTNIKIEPLNDDEFEQDPIDDKHWNVPCVDQFDSNTNYVYVGQHSSEYKPTLGDSKRHSVTEEYLVEKREQGNADGVQKIKFEFHDVNENGIDPDERRESTDTFDNGREGSETQLNKTLLSCDVCFKTFTSRTKLQYHVKTHEGGRQFTCDVCCKSFSRKDSLKTHMLTHKDDKPYNCDVCHRKFCYKNVLKNHMKTHTGVKPFSCEVCQKRFSRVYHLRDHMRTHDVDKMYYSCYICSKQLLSKRYLNIHISKHLEDQQFSCNICMKKFEFKTSLYTHLKRHLNHKPYACDICPLKFKTKSGLQRHCGTHGGDKPFSCDYCSWKFLRKADLIDHTRTHTGEKPFCCDVCQRKFSRQRNLRAHEKTHTSCNKQFSCDVCMQKFVTEANVKAHKSTCHNIF